MSIHTVTNSILEDACRMMAARTHDEWNAAYASLHTMERFDDLDKLAADIIQRAAPVGLAPVALERTERLIADLRNVRILALRVPAPQSKMRERFNENMPDLRAAIDSAFAALNAITDLVLKLGPTNHAKAGGKRGRRTVEAKGGDRATVYKVIRDLADEGVSRAEIRELAKEPIANFLKANSTAKTGKKRRPDDVIRAALQRHKAQNSPD